MSSSTESGCLPAEAAAASDKLAPLAFSENIICPPAIGASSSSTQLPLHSTATATETTTRTCSNTATNQSVASPPSQPLSRRSLSDAPSLVNRRQAQHHYTVRNNCLVRLVGYCLVFIAFLVLLPVLLFMYWPYLLLYTCFVILFVCWYCCCKREPSTGLKREQVYDRLLKRQCEGIVHAAAANAQGAVNVLNNQLVDGPVYWCMLQQHDNGDDEERNEQCHCLLFSKPLSMDEIKVLEATTAATTTAADIENNAETCNATNTKAMVSTVPLAAPDASSVEAFLNVAPPQQQAGAARTAASGDAEHDISNENDETETCSTVQHGFICDICLAEYEAGQVVAWSKNEQCKHAFHVDCITDWLLRRPTCPTCRQEYIDVTKKRRTKRSLR
ncbi:hypothetical protein MPSEU_000401700 [Mayamaea pseudoterrestris]|nr:hypothetical protein MPSEU_000401700 [Mayamaea pseudoterrestris]